MPTVKLAQRLGISVSTASKAKTRGWFYQGFRDAKFKDGKLPPRKKTKFGNLIHLTDEDRRMSISQIVRKFNVSASAAVNARKNGWIAQKLGPSVNILPGGKLPHNILIEDIVSDVDKAVYWVIRRCGFNKQELDDIKQEMTLRLLGQTATVNFINQKWRRKFAYHTGLKYITRKVYPHNRRFICSDLEKFEDNLSDNGLSLETTENNIDYRKIVGHLSLKDRNIIEKWLKKRRSKKIPEKVFKIIKSTRKTASENLN